METIKDFLTQHAKKEPVSFHMPGHKGASIFKENGYGDFLKYIVDLDITEIPGADNLFQPEDIIKATMERYKRLYGSRASYLLINGSTAGIVAAIMASAKEGSSIVMARNCHKSAFNGLKLGRINPVYAYPETVPEYGISGEITADEIARCLDENPEAEAVILPSPNYYGICSDIEAIASEVHGRGKILIVDQAHGAHLKFFKARAGASQGRGPCDLERPKTSAPGGLDPKAGGLGLGVLPKSAEEQGADIVINSTHKTLASFTQTAILNVCTDRVDLKLLEDKLQQIESTSPSYILMMSLDVNADILEKHGERLIAQWMENLEFFYEEAAKVPGLRCLRADNLDYTKINLDMGFDGLELERMLNQRHIYPELVTGNIVMCMTGIGNSREDYERLLAALREIEAERQSSGLADSDSWKQSSGPADSDSWRQSSGPAGADGAGGQDGPDCQSALAFGQKLEMGKMPAESLWIPMEEGDGRVCASSIIPYPPGIPIACPGEILTKELLDYVKALRSQGEKVMGVDEDFRICVGK